MAANLLRRWVLATLLSTSTLCWASPYGFFEVVGGPVETTAVSGNGRLTVGVDQFGQIVACRWPGPGHANQISTAPATPGEAVSAGPAGLSWGLTTGGQTVWLNGTNHTATSQSVGEDVPIIRTQSSIDGLPGPVVQEVFVYGDKDLMAIRLTNSAAIDAGVVWRADFSPCGTLVPEIPFLEALQTGARDFAAFIDGAVVYHVRPVDLASVDWQEAHVWALGLAESLPDCLTREGVWIAYACADGFTSAACESRGITGRRSKLKDKSSGTETIVAVGDCASVITPRLAGHEGDRGVTIFVAFGSSRSEVDETIAFALDRGFDGLLDATRNAWAPVLDGAAQRASPAAPELQGPIAQALTTLIAATGQDSGAIVRAPGAQPLLALDYPRHSIWAGLALDYLGLTETSGRHLEFLLSHVRMEGKRGMPAGSIPAAVYGDGTPGLPYVVLDADAAGWLLWATEQHAGFLSETECERFVADFWPQLDNLSDFLYTRSDPASGVALYSFDPRSLKESATEETVIAHFLGLQSAVVLSEVIGEDRPEWQRRVNQLEDSLVSQALSTEKAWIAKRPLSYWVTSIVDADDPHWDSVWHEIVAGIDARDPHQAIADLCDLALLWKDQPERLQRLKPLLPAAIERSRNARPLDTLDAARIILSVLVVHGS